MPMLQAGSPASPQAGRFVVPRDAPRLEQSRRFVMQPQQFGSNPPSGSASVGVELWDLDPAAK